MELLRQAVAQDSLLLDLDAHNLTDALRAALRLTVSHGKLAADDVASVEQALLERERLGSTAIGHAVAVPHAYLDSFSEQVIVFIRLAKPLFFGAPDGIPTRYVFVLLGPKGSASQHIDTLTFVARLMADDEFRYEAGQATSQLQLVRALDSFLTRTQPPTVPTPAVGELVRTGRFCGGLIEDVRRRLPHYLSDFTDAFHSKALSSTLFLYFACLAPAITFGGIMAYETGNHIGAVEMLLATAVCGVLYAVFSGQPLIVLGGTGPLLVFTAILYQITEALELPFLETRACVGLWTAAFLLLLAATDASWLMRYFTRFTDEIFAALISMIFILWAVEALVDLFRRETTDYDEPMLSLVLAIGTFTLAMSLSRFRRSRYLVSQAREFLSDFGPTIALAIMTLVAIWVHGAIPVETLAAPATVQPTLPRGWYTNPLDTPAWVWWVAALPALLVTVLAFIDQNVTARLVNRADHKLRKGTGYHLDLAVVGVLIGVCSLFGLPWLVAATVRSLNHVRSLATVEELVGPRGEVRERIIHVRENRLSALAIHLLIGGSLLLLPIVRMIPMAVLYGLFLFMGVVSMAGNQFFERLNLWLMDTSLYPSTHYTRRVPRWTIHKFTFVQFMCLAVLWLVEISWLAILFPLFIALLVPIRFILNRYFSREALAALDAEEIPDWEFQRFAE